MLLQIEHQGVQVEETSLNVSSPVAVDTQSVRISTNNLAVLIGVL